MKVISIPAGTRGFDCNTRVSFADARKLLNAGYRFAIRYAPRVTAHNNDLSSPEVNTLLSAGLGIMVVQHVEAETGHGWNPSQAKGKSYGMVAARHALECNIALGTNVWLDLEDIAPGTPHEDVIAYCNAWYNEVARVGYIPGIYVGYNAILSPTELYSRLKFSHYWGAYNLNKDQEPATRGIQMHQGVEVSVPGVAFKIDPDIVLPDKLGGLPLVYAPDEWDV